MRFCYGTFQAVMDLIRSLTEVWRIRDLIAHPLDPRYFVGDRSEQNKLSAMARGDGNLPGIMVTNACNMNPNEIANHFRDVVIKNLRSDMFEIAILALMDIIVKDDIGDDEIVDIVNGLTKKELTLIINQSWDLCLPCQGLSHSSLMVSNVLRSERQG